VVAFCVIIAGGYSAGLAAARSGGVKGVALTLHETGQTLLTSVVGIDVSQRESGHSHRSLGESARTL
jgi:hypothetical protein